MPVRAIDPFEKEDKTGGTTLKAIDPFEERKTPLPLPPVGKTEISIPKTFSFLNEDIAGTQTSTPEALLRRPFEERGTLGQIFSKEVLGPTALFEAGKEVAKTAVEYPAETVEAAIRGVYGGAIEPVIEAGVRFAPLIPKEKKEEIIEKIRKPAEMPETAVFSEERLPSTIQDIRRGFEISGVIAPFTATEFLAVNILPRLPTLITRGIAWVSAGQILHKPEEGSRVERAVADLMLLGTAEMVGAAIRPLFRALTRETQGTISNLLAGEKVAVREAEGAAAEVRQRVAFESRAAEASTETYQGRTVKEMTDDLIKGRNMVLEEEKKVARSLVDEYNLEFPNKRFPLKDIPGASRRLEALESSAQSKITRLQQARDFLAKPLIEEDLAPLRETISELRKELSALRGKGPKVVKPRELPFMATDAEMENVMASVRIMAEDDLRWTIINLELKLARMESGTMQPTMEQIATSVRRGGTPKRDMERIFQEARRMLQPELAVKDRIVQIEKDILRITNEVGEKNKLLQGILDAGTIAEKRVRERFPQMYDYKNYLKSLIQASDELPKINFRNLDWRPPTLSFNNPYTQQVYKWWDTLERLWDQRMPRFLKVAKSEQAALLVRERQRVMDGITRKQREEILKVVERKPFAERAKIGLMISKYIPVPEDYAPTIASIDLEIGKLGKAIVDINKKWVEDGLIDPANAFLAEEVWFRNLGEYSRAFYGRGTAPSGEVIIQPAAGAKVSAFVNRSQFKKKLTIKEWGENYMRFEGATEEDILKASAEELVAKGELAKKQYGWIYEADAVLEKTFRDSINNYATMQWQDAIVRDPMLFAKTEVDGFVPVKSFLRQGVETDARLGPLNNGWIHPGLSEELELFINRRRDASETFLGELLNWWKIEKVAAGPAVFRNYVSGGLVQTDMAGAPVWTPKNSKTYVATAKDYFKSGERYKFWRDRGLFGSDFFQVEISDDMWREISKSANPYSTLAAKMENLSREGKEYFRYYGAIDHLHRTYLAEFAVKNGATAEQAVHYANKWQLDYRYTPQFLDKLRRGIGGAFFPFVSFYTLMMPRILEVTMTRPWVMMKYPLVGKVMEYIAMQKLGLTPEQVENGKPEFLKDQPYSVLMPVTDSAGNPQYLNLSYTLPFGSWETGFIDWRQYLDMAKTGGLAGVIRALIENRDPFTEKSIWTEADEALGLKNEKILIYVLKGFGPAMMPHIMNLYGAATGEVIGFPFERQRDFGQSVFRALGTSVYSGGYNEAFWKIETLENQIQQINLALTRTLTNKNVSEDEKNRIHEEAVEQIQELSSQVSEIYRNMPPAPGELGQTTKGRTGGVKAVDPFAQ